MNWNIDMEFDVIFTDTAKAQIKNILDYIFYELENEQAARSVEQDMKETATRLAHVAGYLKLCDDPDLRSLEYRTIHLKHHRYFMIYKIVKTQVFIAGVYHDLQDYENIFH